MNNYNTSIATMTECMENPKFSAFVEKMRVAPECNGLSFASFLIQPIQRLPVFILFYLYFYFMRVNLVVFTEIRVVAPRFIEVHSKYSRGLC